MGRQVYLPDAEENVPTAEWVTTHGSKKKPVTYLYRFYGASGQARVEVLKEPYAEVAYALRPGTCSCSGFGYRNGCKHHDDCKAAWAVWPTLVALYHKAGRAAVQVDLRALARTVAAAGPANLPEVLHGDPS